MKRNEKVKSCVVCGGGLKPVKSRFQGFEIDAYKCVKCGEELFDPLQAEKILEANKAMQSVFKVVLGQIQSNLIVRIPVQVSQALDLKKGEELELEVGDKNSICLKIPKDGE